MLSEWTTLLTGSRTTPPYGRSKIRQPCSKVSILWPFEFRFSLSASDIFGVIDDRAEAAPVNAAEAYRELALRLEANYDVNAKRIKALFWLFRIAILALTLEVGAWIAAVERL